MSDPHILPAQASPTGNYRGVCDWADRPLTFNSVGDTLRIADRGLVAYIWNGTAWVSNFAAPEAIGGTTPDAGSFTTLSASSAAKFAAGTAAAPSIAFIGDPDTGLISSAANALGFVTGGTERWMVNASGALNPIADNTYDIGGATKPRDISAGRRITSPNVAITATAPASATDTGTAGEIRADADYIYVCTATDTWKRVAIATWA